MAQDQNGEIFDTKEQESSDSGAMSRSIGFAGFLIVPVDKPLGKI